MPIVGSPVGEDFLIWPKTEYPEELFKATSGQSLFSIVNGSCVDDPGSMASDLTAKSLQDLDIATNRDIIGIALANLIVSTYHLLTKLQIFNSKRFHIERIYILCLLIIFRGFTGDVLRSHPVD